MDVFPAPAAIELSRRAPYQIDGPARVLVLPDAHIPYHDLDAVNIALEYGLEHYLTHILINGDWIDFYALSEFEKDPKKRCVADEIADGTNALRYLRRRDASAKIIYKCGNHDVRLQRYIWRKAPELAGLPSITIQAMMELDKIGIDWVESRQLTRLGKLPVFHGHEYKYGITSPVNPARGLFLRAKCGALCSHHHQWSQHSERTAEGKLISTWSTGCLCDTSPDYSPFNNWSHGFAFIEIAENGAYDVQNLRIIKGKVYA
jgi:predicted phosphodiesterase